MSNKLTDKLAALFNLVPEVKDRADATDAALVALGVTSKEAGRYLVSGEGGDHLPVRDENGKLDHTLMGAAHAALRGGYRGNKYEGPQKAEALSKLVALYKSEGMETPSDSTAEKKEMDTKDMTDAEKKKMQDEMDAKKAKDAKDAQDKKDAAEDKKDGVKDSPAEDAAEAKKKEFDLAIAGLKDSLEASAKESKDLRELLNVTVKETNELKSTLKEGFEAVVKGFEQRDNAIKLMDAKVKELAGEIPNAARNAYTPSENMQNVFARIANGDLQGLQPILKEVATSNAPAQQQAVNPIFDFVNQANQHVGLAPVTNQALPQ